MNKYAIITGASSGIGMELAHVMAQNGHNLVLVARRLEKLNQLAATIIGKYKTKVHVIAKDLTQTNAAQEIVDETKNNGFYIDILVNNAGFGDFGLYIETNKEKEMQMMQLNMIALTQLTKIYLPEMVKNDDGRILNIASVAAFMPGPYMVVYYATKAFVLSYSEGIAEELKGSGVSITAFCPGPVATGFEAAADMAKSGLFKNQKIAQVEPVARDAYKQMMKRKVVAINGIQFKIMLRVLNLLPRSIVRTSVMKIQKG